MKHLSIATLGAMLAVSLTASAQIASAQDKHAGEQVTPRPPNAGADDAASRSRESTTM